MSIKVLLADDAAIMRSTIRHLLEEQPEIELVGEASDFNQTIALTRKFQPQVVIMDLHMLKSLELTPLDVGHRLHSAAASVLAISIWNDEDTETLAHSFGTTTLLNKMRLGDQLIPAVMKLASVDKKVANRFVRNVHLYFAALAATTELIDSLGAFKPL